MFWDLFPNSFIPGAHDAREAVEVVGVVLGPPDYVGGEDAGAAAAAFRTERPVKKRWILGCVNSSEARVQNHET